jgi:LuxR family maltose regulon positive regulatory protein
MEHSSHNQPDETSSFNNDAFRLDLRDELFLQSRLTVPPQAPEIVARPRVDAALDAIWRYPVTLVAAPTGFGKTTLISSWAQRQSAALAWVSLDPEIVDPRRFWAHVAYALEQAAPGAGADVLQQLDAAAVAALARIATLLAHALARPGTPLALVIDDVHLLPKTTIDQLALLADHLPPGTHLVLVSRTDPPLPLARWRAKDRLLEVRAETLRFTAAESQALLTRRLGQELAAADVATLAARTEGWAAGLQLAALILREQPDRHAAIESLHGSHRFVIDYLVEEVLSRQTPEVQAFLAATAWLERLSGPLCNAVTGRTDGQAQLEELERRNLFVIPLDTDRRWYRYHYLFAECVRAWSQRHTSLDGVQVQRRAAAWWLAQGRPREAIGALLAAEAYTEALPHLAALVPELIRQGEMLTVARWLDPVPPATLATLPELTLAYTWLLGFTHRIAEAERLLEVLRRTPQEGITPAMFEEIAMLHELMDAMRGAPLPVGMTERPAFQRALHAYPFLSALTVFPTLDDPLPADHRAMPAGTASAPGLDPVQNVFGQARRLFQQGRLRAADQALSAALADAPTATMPPMMAILYVVWADVLLAQNRLTAAEDAVEHAGALAEQLGNRHVHPLALSVKLHVLRARGDLQAAAGVDAELTRYRRDPLMLHLLQPVALTEQLRYAVLIGDRAAAAERDAELSAVLTLLSNVSTYLQAAIALVRARAAWELFGRDVRAQVEATLADATIAGWGGLAIEAHLLLARIALARRDVTAARTAFTAALALAAAEDALRSVRDVGADLPNLLKLLAPSDRLAPEVRGFVIRLQAAMAPGEAALPPPVRAAPSVPPLVEPLSEREDAVLRLLAEGLTNRQLADRLMVAEGTIKTHLMNIYGKLNAHNRTQAIARARELGLI